MKSKLLSTFIAAILFLLPNINFAQAPNLGTTSGFAVFTAAGAFNVAGASTLVTGDVGTNAGADNSFPPGILIGQKHVVDAVSATAATDVALAYGSLSTVTCGLVISTTMGSGQSLLPNVYCLGAASTVNGDLILDGGGDPTSIFIFKINGALATTVDSRIILTNGASICNVYWQVNGEVDLGENSTFRGTILANGAIHLLNGASLYGRALSQAGAISLENNIVSAPQQLTPSVITPTGPISFCAGGSIVLSGNVGGTWSTGATTPSITVSTAGDYFVTNTSIAACSDVISNHITVTVNPLPTCTITGNLSICSGGSTQLCATGGVSYIWSTGATTSCITVSTAGKVSVTVTDASGCSSTCEVTVIVNPLPTCTITGNLTICAGGSTQLCASGGTSYLWSTGATTDCITVSTAGIYSVTVSGANGCSSICQVTVIVNPKPNCSITGNLNICAGSSTQLCASGGTSYLWSTGATTACISVNTSGIYSVTVTGANGCSSTCQVTVNVNPLPICSISGNLIICTGGSTQLCASGGDSYLWSTGATTNCITVSTAGTYTVTVTGAGGCKSTCSKTVVVNPLPSCTITGTITFCPGGSTQLCAPAGTLTYLWSTGATTRCITVNTAGTYSVVVTNANGCNSTCSKDVTINPLPVCSITGNGAICPGQSTQLCAIAGMSSYLWSTGATSRCITVSTAGTYSVTITNSNGCSSMCNKEVTVNAQPTCLITGNDFICQGGSIQLCVPAGATSYLWSTGAKTNCITVSAAGTYSVTVTNGTGCVSTCSKTVSVKPLPNCSITGNGMLCPGGSTQLCATAGMAGYLWSTGATTQCITVSTAGTYTVTITDAFGCSSSCNKQVGVNTPPICTISGNSALCEGLSTQLCAPSGYASYLWSTGATTSCIFVNTAGTYSVTVTDANGCTSSCNKEVTVKLCTILCQCISCNGNDVVVNQNVNINFNTLNPTYTGDPDLLPFVSYDKSGGTTADKWKVVFNLGSNRLIVKTGATISVSQVNGFAPGIVINDSCALVVESGGAIKVISNNKNGGDIVLNINGNITLNGEVRDEVTGTQGLPGAITGGSKCGNITVGPSGLIQVLGIDFGGNTLSLSTCGADCQTACSTECLPGDITINGLLLSYAHAHGGNLTLNRPNIKVVSLNGAITINANSVEPLFDEFSLNGTLYDLYGGLLSWVRDNANPGKVEVQAKNNITVNSHGTDPTGPVRESFGAIAAISSGSSSPGGLVDVRSLAGGIIANNRAFDVSGKNLLSTNFARIRLYSKLDISLNRPGANNNFNPVLDATSPSSGGKGGTNELRSYTGGITIGANVLVSAAVPAGSGSVQGTNLLKTCTGLTNAGTITPAGVITTDCSVVVVPAMFTDCPLTQVNNRSDRAEPPYIVSDKVNVYPNPTTGLVTISFQSTSGAKSVIKIMDVTGRIILTDNIYSIQGDNLYKVDMSTKVKGMYYVLIDGDKTQKKAKIVVQ